jgi:hypothetical protein
VKPSLEDVLEKAAQLQELVPGAVLVGGSAAALHAHHRQSFDHDHVVVDLAERFDTTLQNLEALGDWSMTRAQPGKIILGELGGIETGVRQLLRSRPLETTDIEVRGKRLVVPTAAEILRIKAWLALSRNQTRDYLDIAALADRIGLDEATAHDRRARSAQPRRGRARAPHGKCAKPEFQLTVFEPTPSLRAKTTSLAQPISSCLSACCGLP